MVERKENLDKVRALLTARKKDLEQMLIELSTEKLTDEQIGDVGDQALTSTMEALRNSLQDAELEEYNMLLKAIEKIDDGSYGICMECGQPISERRLKLYPNAARCLSCQEALEGQQLT